MRRMCEQGPNHRGGDSARYKNHTLPVPPPTDDQPHLSRAISSSSPVTAIVTSSIWVCQARIRTLLWDLESMLF